MICAAVLLGLALGVRPGSYPGMIAGGCRKQFTVRVGTVFEAAHIPLSKMLQAVYLMTSSKKGISAHQLHRTLEADYKSAWFLAPPMGGESKAVEVDEAFIGKLEGHEKEGGLAHKNIVLTLVERGGSARSFHVSNASVTSVVPIVRTNFRRESRLMTDKAKFYKGVGKEFGEHGVPINVSISKLVSIGGQNVSFQGGLRYWATGPAAGPDGLGYRFSVTFLFPK